MAVPTRVHDAAHMLATYVDRSVAERSSSTRWVIAIVPADDGGGAKPQVFKCRGPVSTLGPPPPAAVSAVALSATGRAVRLDPTVQEDALVRVTVAITCCTTAVVVRRDSGVVDRSGCADGRLVDLLRSWAEPYPCASCLTRSGSLGPLV